MEDTAIIDLFWQRSDSAIAETDAKYGRYCSTIAYNICLNQEDAEECVSDTYFKAWNLMPDKRPKVLSSFLGCITRNLALDRYKSSHRQKRGEGELPLALEELEQCIPDNSSPERELERRELAAAINVFVSQLAKDDQQIFISRYWYMASMEEIAHATGFSVGKVKTRLFRARAKLKNYLEVADLC